MGIISFTWDKNYLYMLGYYILEIFGIMVEYFLKENEKNETKKDTNINNNLCSHFFKVFLLIIADLLIFPLAICIKCRSKRENQEIVYLKNKIHSKNYDKNKSRERVYLIFLISILDLISRSVYFSFFFINTMFKRESIGKLPERYHMDYIVILDIFFRYLFAKIILNTKIFRHHIASIIICFLGFAIYIGIDLFSIDFNINVILYILIILPRAIFFPLEDAVNEKLLSYYFLLPQYLMLFRGLIELVVFSLFTIIAISLKIELFNINMDAIFIIKCLFSIVYSVKAFFLIEIIYIFNSQFVSFLVVSETIGGTIIMFIKGDSKENIFVILEIKALILVLFGTLIYNEIIIINLCGLSEKTGKNLKLEEEAEREDQLMSENIRLSNID